MTAIDSRPDTASDAATPPPYEPPMLSPLGNLHDLLATTNGSACDGSNNPSSGSNPDDCL
jgi:hypothetical protein